MLKMFPKTQNATSNILLNLPFVQTDSPQDIQLEFFIFLIDSSLGVIFYQNSSRLIFTDRLNS